MMDGGYSLIIVAISLMLFTIFRFHQKTLALLLIAYFNEANHALFLGDYVNLALFAPEVFLKNTVSFSFKSLAGDLFAPLSKEPFVNHSLISP